MNLLGRGAAVAADEDQVCIEECRKEITNLVSDVLVEIYVIDSADVVCVKCSHVEKVLSIYSTNI